MPARLKGKFVKVFSRVALVRERTQLRDRKCSDFFTPRLVRLFRQSTHVHSPRPNTARRAVARCRSFFPHFMRLLIRPMQLFPGNIRCRNLWMYLEDVVITVTATSVRSSISHITESYRALFANDRNRPAALPVFSGPSIFR